MSFLLFSFKFAQLSIRYHPTYLKEAFAATCRKRGSEAVIPSFDEVLETIEVLPEMQDAWENYKKNNSYVEGLTWGEAVRAVKHLKEQIN